jgi:hypothetical protein
MLGVGTGGPLSEGMTGWQSQHNEWPVRGQNRKQPISNMSFRSAPIPGIPPTALKPPGRTPSGNPQLRLAKREIEVAAEREPYAGFVEHCATPSMWLELYRSAILFPIRARIPRGWEGSRPE